MSGPPMKHECLSFHFYADDISVFPVKYFWFEMSVAAVALAPSSYSVFHDTNEGR